MPRELKIDVFKKLNYFQINEFVERYGIETFPDESISEKDYFIMIERAVKFKLSRNQKLFILNSGDWAMSDKERLSAKCIKLALSKGIAINLRYEYANIFELYAHHNNPSFVYTKGHAQQNSRFFSIWLKLKKYGFVVRDIIDK